MTILDFIGVPRLLLQLQLSEICLMAAATSTIMPYR